MEGGGNADHGRRGKDRRRLRGLIALRTPTYVTDPPSLLPIRPALSRDGHRVTSGCRNEISSPARKTAPTERRINVKRDTSEHDEDEERRDVRRTRREAAFRKFYARARGMRGTFPREAMSIKRNTEEKRETEEEEEEGGRGADSTLASPR